MKNCVEVKSLPSIINYWGIYYSGKLVDDSYSQDEAIRKGREICLDLCEKLNTSVELVVEREVR
jgi:hypothetical protein